MGLAVQVADRHGARCPHSQSAHPIGSGSGDADI